FSGELAHINPILPEIKEAGFDLEEEIHLIENLLYNNSSPRPPEELNAEIADTIVESFPSSLIPVQDNDSQREETDIVSRTDELLSPSFENDDYDPGEIDVVEELLVDNSISNSKNELSDNEASDFDNLSFPRPPPEPPDDEFLFDLEPDSPRVYGANKIGPFCLKEPKGKDYAKTVKNQSKPGNIGHKIGSLHQKPDQRAFFYNNQANEAKC
nr:hypothetical protein [Tanacetum cinerariifolium]